MFSLFQSEDNKKSFKESMKAYIKNRMTQLGLNFNEEIVEDIYDSRKSSTRFEGLDGIFD